jgi:sugar diacid utilization regulator
MSIIPAGLSTLGGLQVDGVHLSATGWWATAGPCSDAEVRAEVADQLAAIDPGGGAVTIRGRRWGWAFPLPGAEAGAGHLVVGSDEAPPPEQLTMLELLAEQTGAGLASATDHRTIAVETAAALALLQRRADIHGRLDRAALTGDGPQGLAAAMHDITGHAAVIEDAHGNIEAWAGTAPVEPHPSNTPGRREPMLAQAEIQPGAFRAGDRVVAVATGDGQALGVVALVIPVGHDNDLDHEVVEHAASVLAIQLHQLHRITESEARAGGGLAERLLAGDSTGARVRARALGYDLGRPHRVVVIRPRPPGPIDDAALSVVRRVARDTGVGSLLVALDDTVVLLAHDDHRWVALRAAVEAQLGGSACDMGVGSACDDPSDLPRSHHEAVLALKLRHTADGGGTVAYDDLGIYRLLAEVADHRSVERFVHDWLGALVDYDRANGADLVTTLSRYFELGGSYDHSAEALGIHRNTLKYRLKRIRSISGHDLADPDTYFQMQLATRAWHTLAALRDA